MTRTKRRAWAGLDGEGLDKAPHRYVLLAVSTDDGESYTAENYDGLSSLDCLRFLTSLPQNLRLAGYYLGYDWTMILRDLPDRSIYRLLRPETRELPADEGGGHSWVRWRSYALHYLGGMMRIKRERGPCVTVWDLGKYYQAPFVDTLKKWGVAGVDVAEVAAMKEARDTFTPEMRERIRRYCLTECRALADLATQLEQAHVEVGLRPNAWYGPGSTASAAHKKLGTKEKRGDDLIPPAARLPIDTAFFGGRFEQREAGRFARVWGRDIASAYPYQAYRLPCLEHGRWFETRSESRARDARHALVRFTIDDVGDVPWGPLPVRLPSGAIVFPRSGGSGWVWRDEWLAAREGWNGLRFESAWCLDSDCVCRPFEPLLEWYRERVRIGKSGKGIVLKLALNSIYGKLAQTVGHPQFASRVWAGMITSGTRAQLLRAMLAHSSLDAVVAVATDGIYALEEATLERSELHPETLGSWDSEYHGAMVFARPGIYWSEDDPTVRARGLGRKKLAEQRDVLGAAIERGETGVVELGTSRMFGGARACVYRTRTGELRRSRHYGEWHDVPARLSLSPAPKRRSDWSLHRLDGVESRPYSSSALSDDARVLQLMGELMWGNR